MSARLFRVIVPVTDIDRAAALYAAVLAIPGRRVSPGRHYFDCGGTILACFDPTADGDGHPLPPNPDHVYLVVQDLQTTFQRAQAAGCRTLDPTIQKRPWGEISFYAQDPFGNPICFVDEKTIFTRSTRILRVGPCTRGLRAEGPRKQERQRSSLSSAKEKKIAGALVDLAGVPANDAEYRGHGRDARATGNESNTNACAGAARPNRH